SEPVIGVASCAHISAYSASVAAIAAVFWPRMLVAISAVSWARLAATMVGGTVAANAASNAPADNRAWLATRSAWTDVALSHSTNGAAAAALDNDAGPSHVAPVSPETVEPKALPAELNRAAHPSHAPAAPP